MDHIQKNALNTKMQFPCLKNTNNQIVGVCVKHNFAISIFFKCLMHPKNVVVIFVPKKFHTKINLP